MVIMAKQPKKPAAPRGRPRINKGPLLHLHINMDKDIAELAVRYCNDLETKPTMKRFAELAFLYYLASKGYHLPSEDDSDRVAG